MIAVVVAVASCAPSLGTDGVSGLASAMPSASSAPSCLSGRRLDLLTDQFFVRYNARDLEGFLGLLRLAGVEIRPAQTVPGLRVLRIACNDSLELRNGFSRPARYPEMRGLSQFGGQVAATASSRE